jgi:TPR repeat protein
MNKNFLRRKFWFYAQVESKILALEHTFEIDITKKKSRVALIAISNMCATLVFRLMSLPAVCSSIVLMRHASCITSRLRASILRNQADALYQKGHQLKDNQLYRDAAKLWAQATLFKHGPSHAYLSTILIEGRQNVPKNLKLAFKLASIGTDLCCYDSKGVFSRCITASGYCSDLALNLGWESANAGSCFGEHAIGERNSFTYRKAAMKGHADAQYRLAIRIRYGTAPDEGAIEAKLWLNNAAAQGHVRAQHYLAEMLYEEELYGEALSFYKLAAEQGCVESQFKLGNMLATGKHVIQDYTEAVRFYRLAAEQGHAEAQLISGNMFASGCGVERDDFEAVRFYLIVSTKNCSEHIRTKANFNLACMLANGRGIEKNMLKAMELGCSVIEASTALLYRSKTFREQLIVFEDTEVVNLYRLAASYGIAIAQYYLAVMIANGRGDTQDNGEAIRLYNLARSQGYKHDRLYAEDVTLLKIAATQKCLSAQIDLADHFRLDENPVESLKFYHLAAAQGCVVAKYWLGWMYHYKQCGIVSRVEAIKKAERWYTLAAEQGFPAAFNGLKQLRRFQKK